LWSELADPKKQHLLPVPGTLDILKAQKTVRAATYVFMQGFEHPVGGSLNSRTNFACGYYARFMLRSGCRY